MLLQAESSTSEAARLTSAKLFILGTTFKRRSIAPTNAAVRARGLIET
jgi:hypothetical protein